MGVNGPSVGANYTTKNREMLLMISSDRYSSQTDHQV